MSIELTRSQSISLSRLSRCPRWTEVGRIQNFVVLRGFRKSLTEEFNFPEQDLKDLLAAGKIECDASSRLAEEYKKGLLGVEEVTIKYWRVLPDATQIRS